MTDASTAALLDECIDALLAGEDWRNVVPPTHTARAEIAQLMRIAGKLRAADSALVRPSRIRATQDATRAKLASRAERNAP